MSSIRWMATAVACLALLAGACTAAPPATSPASPTSPGLAAPTTAVADIDPLEEFAAEGAPITLLPPPSWQVACQGVDPDMCREMANGTVGPRRPGQAPVHTVLVRCTSGSCQDGDAEGETILIFADGSVETVGNWGSSRPPAGPVVEPPPPVRPAGDWELECDRVPRRQCEEFAVETYEAINARSLELAALTVTCVADSCTDEKGAIMAVATLADGSQLELGSMEYSTSGP